MKNYLLLALSLFVFAVRPGCCQVAVRAASSPASVSAAPSAIASTSATYDATLQPAAGSTSVTSTARRRPGSKTSTTVAVKQATRQVAGSAAGSSGGSSSRSTLSSTPSAYTMLSFVINRGRVFAPDAPGEITSIRLSGYHRGETGYPEAGSETSSETSSETGFEAAFETNSETVSSRGYVTDAAINEVSSINSLTLSGRACINSDNSGRTTASVMLCPLSAPQGLTLTLTVDGDPLSVTLPFVSSDRRWRSGYRYLYTVTVSGGTLVVEGVTPSTIATAVER